VIGISVDGVSDHEKWSKDIEKSQGHAINYPLIGDPELKAVKQYDMLLGDAGDTSEGRTAADNATARSVFVIGPDKKIKATLTYPMSTGQNFDEILRLLDSCQLTAKEKVATPVNWKQGEDVVILPAVSDDEAKAKYPDGWKTPLPYLCIVPQPKSPAKLMRLVTDAAAFGPPHCCWGRWHGVLLANGDIRADMGPKSRRMMRLRDFMEGLP
jgi:alkyl hydroperoxide reductase subunit AhpC